MQTVHLTDLAAADSSEAFADEVSVFVPGTSISVFSIDVPNVPKRKWSKLIPFMVEEKVLQPVEQLHFSWSVNQELNRLMVFVVAKAEIDGWLAIANASNARVVRFVPDWLALPLYEQAISFSPDGEVLKVRTGPNAGFCAHKDTASSVLDAMRLGDTAQDTTEFSLIWCSEVASDAYLPNREVIRSSNYQGIPVEENLDVNLLVGDYKPKSEFGAYRDWLPLAAAAGLCAIALVVLGLFQLDHKLAQVDELLQARSVRFTQVFGSPLGSAEFNLARDQKLEQLERQFFANRSSQLELVRKLDAVLSNCRDCNIASLTGADKQLSIDLEDNPNVRRGLDRIEGLDANWIKNDTAKQSSDSKVDGQTEAQRYTLVVRSVADGA